MAPLVSVIMPCYNDGKYIQEAVNSVLHQTYTEWELIIVDDGSTDKKTREILDNIATSRIHVLKNEHKGVVAARNEGIRYASGKYIVPLDADDVARPRLLEKYVEIMENNPNVGIVYCLYEYFGMRYGIYELPNFSVANELVSNCINNTSMYRKKDWERVNGYNPNMEIGCEDYDFWLSILELEREVCLVPEVLLYYRVKIRRGRTKSIDSDKVKEISKQIIENHQALYQKYWFDYMIVERERRIDLQNQINIIYGKRFKFRNWLYSYPLLYRLLHYKEYRRVENDKRNYTNI